MGQISGIMTVNFVLATAGKRKSFWRSDDDDSLFNRGDRDLNLSYHHSGDDMEVWLGLYLDNISVHRLARKISLKYLPYIGNEFILG